ncbi:hypothetical protein F2Q69_00022792 [Brassica cretica]|uniref:Uncharacterized protein n=1 Tax=Brassica cretica TaxID=69181 RepID=A0A8S9QAR4_BRACR|nr:hypothetical protein F2Q69_00022792 [Brassica cretica]
MDPNQTRSGHIRHKTIDIDLPRPGSRKLTSLEDPAYSDLPTKTRTMTDPKKKSLPESESPSPVTNGPALDHKQRTNHTSNRPYPEERYQKIKASSSMNMKRLSLICPTMTP